MQRMRLGRVAGMVAGVAAAMSLGEHPSGAQVPCKYDVRIVSADFCSVGTSPILPRGINNQDPPTVVGSYRVCAPSDDRPFYWKTDEPNITPMGLPPGKSAANAADINNVIGKLGVGQIIDNYFAGYLWDDGEWIEIPPPPGEANIRPNSIASERLIVAATSSDKTFHAARWDGTVSEVLELPYGVHQFGRGISPDGSKIAGYMELNPSLQRAFIWEGGQVIDPGWLPGSTVTRLEAVNDFGEATGFVRIPDSSSQCESVGVAVVWRNDELTAIGSLPPRLQSIGHAISNSGIVAGIAITYGTCNGCGCPIPFVWSEDTGILELQTLIDLSPSQVYLHSVWAINEAGDIACGGGISGNGNVAVVLTPLPRNGDVNCDNYVDLHDLVDVIHSWGPCRGCRTDLTGDWTVNVDDLLEVINNWGT